MEVAMEVEMEVAILGMEVAMVAMVALEVAMVAVAVVEVAMVEVAAEVAVEVVAEVALVLQPPFLGTGSGAKLQITLAGSARQAIHAS